MLKFKTVKEAYKTSVELEDFDKTIEVSISTEDASWIMKRFEKKDGKVEATNDDILKLQNIMFGDDTKWLIDNMNDWNYERLFDQVFNDFFMTIVKGRVKPYQSTKKRIQAMKK